MPVNESMMRALKKKYGDEKGEQVYYAMENKRKHEKKRSKSKTKKGK